MATFSQYVAKAAASSFTYQGKLNDSVGVPLTGAYDFTFRLYNDPTASLISNKIGSDVVVSAVDVVNGLFTVKLDFGGGAFDGGARWLETSVAGVTLTPRVEITSSPMSLFSSAPWQTISNLNYSRASLEYVKLFAE